jgi:hypothetical protein
MQEANNSEKIASNGNIFFTAVILHQEEAKSDGVF